MEERAELREVEPDMTFQVDGDYADAPINKPLKANLVYIKVTEQIDNFKTKPGGEENPNYGKPVKKYIWGFKVNDSELEADGQVYTKWTGAFPTERSDMGKISEALLGSWDEIKRVTAKDLLGLPIQITLKPGTKDPSKLQVNADKLFPADKGQEKIDVDAFMVEAVKPTKDVVVEPDTDLDAVEAVFGPDVKKVG